ncbi:endonuclease/exonuclease/phosphatase family protein [Persicitalea sp.]|uniref:endonuclease/exonuclease/phosphatase family protein n=1 Tax=Persicitalea sp. TaxID=3100273 RepID=UPI003594228D
MKTIRRFSLYLLLAFGTALISITLLSLSEDSSRWYLKILDFPRLQVILGLAICLLFFLIFNKKWNPSSFLFAGGLTTSLALQTYILLPYLPFSSEAAASASNSVDSQKVLSVMVANVYMKNRSVDNLLEIVTEKDPTLFLAMEVNKWWTEQLSPLHERYPHRISYPADNTYGMALYSKLPLDEHQILFFNQDSVPSFRAKVKLADGSVFQLLTLHPVPPKPSEHPDNVGEKEVALMKAGRLIADSSPLPALVMGDLNDVGWSYNSQRFEALSNLHDLRRGRGLYNTFDAHSIWMRWPLDYIYVSKEFKVRKLERLSSFGSDHFPYYAELVFGAVKE